MINQLNNLFITFNIIKTIPVPLRQESIDTGLLKRVLKTPENQANKYIINCQIYK